MNGNASLSILLVLAVLFLAATNGANDNFKGVAALYGSGRASYRVSLFWASLATLAGSLCSVWFAHALLQAFTGAGLVPASIALQTRFACAVAGGGAITVALAAWRGLPISTTHALIGALCGAGLVAVGTGVHFGTLGTTFLLPVLASPLVALVLAAALTPPIRRWVARLAVADACVCVAPSIAATPANLGLHEVAVPSALPARILIETQDWCRALDARPLWRWDAHGAADALLFLLGGTVSFARGLNDTPKIAALLVSAGALRGHAQWAVGLVGPAMLIGGVIGARRVARTLSHRITPLALGAALAAGVTTSLLVGTASFDGLPVSTTHVSVGALAGTGLRGAGVDRRVLKAIGLSWLATLPAGAAFGAVLYALLH